MTGTEAAEWPLAGVSVGLVMKILQATWLKSISVLVVTACSAGSGPDVEVVEGSPVESQDEALSGNALSPAQANTALRLIDDICADTWCSGDYDFGFRRLTCNRPAKTCTLTLQVFAREALPSQAQSFWRSCKTTGFTGFSSLVDSTANGYQSLNDEYYDALTACTTRIVSRLH